MMKVIKTFKDAIKAKRFGDFYYHLMYFFYTPKNVYLLMLVYKEAGPSQRKLLNKLYPEIGRVMLALDAWNVVSDGKRRKMLAGEFSLLTMLDKEYNDDNDVAVH